MKILSEMKGRRHRRACGYIKLLGGLLMMLTVCFGIKLYLDQGLWDLEEYTTGVCSEAYYNFNDGYVPEPDVFHDKEHFRRCRSAFEMRQPRRYGPGDGFYIKTKCGYVLPVLLSKKKLEVRVESEDYVVPNIVHYLYFGVRWEMDFLNYLSFLSVSKFIKPDHIFIHGNVVPSGPWWNRTIQEVPNIYHVHREQPVRIQGRKILRIEESANILRVQTLLDNGGIYLDSDVLVVKSFDPLRKYEVTIGRENPKWLNNGIVVAEPGSMFLCVWRGIWSQYRPYFWNFGRYSMESPSLLSKIIPDHIHVEEDSLQKPDGHSKHLLYIEHYDWSQNYAIHVFKHQRPRPIPEGPSDINNLDTTLGEVMRYVYYNSKELRPH